MRVLAIETSCDETAVAILDDRRIVADLIASQDDLHHAFGGVVPELASRRHLERLPAMVEAAREQAHFQWKDFDGIAVTRAPGLIGALLVGVAFAKGVAFAQDLPLIGVNHLEGHLLVAGLEYPELAYPFLGLIVSGGHTSVYLAQAPGQYQLLGATRDDAAGEAFDKCAKLLGLGYPGGPAIDRVAAQGDPHAVRFVRPMLRTKGSRFEIGQYDFSFSGLKTAVHQQVQQMTHTGHAIEVADLAASFQHRVIEELVSRIVAAAQAYTCPRIVVAGGVAANRAFRARLHAQAMADGWTLYIPSHRYCTDNAVMIAWAGAQRLARGERHGLDLNATAVEELGQLAGHA